MDDGTTAGILAFIAVLLGIFLGVIFTLKHLSPVEEVKDNKVLIQCADNSREWMEITVCKDKKEKK